MRTWIACLLLLVVGSASQVIAQMPCPDLSPGTTPRTYRVTFSTGANVVLTRETATSWLYSDAKSAISLRVYHRKPGGGAFAGAGAVTIEQDAGFSYMMGFQKTALPKNGLGPWTVTMVGSGTTQVVTIQGLP